MCFLFLQIVFYVEFFIDNDFIDFFVIVFHRQAVNLQSQILRYPGGALAIRGGFQKVVPEVVGAEIRLMLVQNIHGLVIGYVLLFNGFWQFCIQTATDGMSRTSPQKQR